jgi:hypothetical protein
VRVFYIAKLEEMRDGELDLMPDRETLSKLEWHRLGRRFEELQEFGGLPSIRRVKNHFLRKSHSCNVMAESVHFIYRSIGWLTGKIWPKN